MNKEIKNELETELATLESDLLYHKGKADYFTFKIKMITTLLNELEGKEE